MVLRELACQPFICLPDKRSGLLGRFSLDFTRVYFGGGVVVLEFFLPFFPPL